MSVHTDTTGIRTSDFWARHPSALFIEPDELSETTIHDSHPTPTNGFGHAALRFGGRVLFRYSIYLSIMLGLALLFTRF